MLPEFLGLSPQFLDYGGRLLIATIMGGVIGIACGAERYGLAAIALVLATIILALLRPLERFLPGNGSSQRDKSEAKATPPDS